MKTKVAWRCQEIFFFCWMVSIYQKQVIHFFMGSKLAIPSQHFHRRWIKALSRQIQKFFCSNATTNAKKWIFPINFALLLFFSGCIELIEIKGPDHVQRELGWPFKSKCFFTIYFFFAQSTWSGPLYNPKELQLTLSTTYILKSGSGKTNYKICLGTKPALMDCLLNVLS